MDLKLRVWRQEGPTAPGKFEEYDVPGVSPDMSFLELFDVLNERLLAQGWDLDGSRSKLIPLIAGSDPDVLRLLLALEARELFGFPFVEPATPRNRGLIRLSINCDLTPAELERVVEICRQVRGELA